MRNIFLLGSLLICIFLLYCSDSSSRKGQFVANDKQIEPKVLERTTSSIEQEWINQTLERKQILSGKASMLIPESFTLMGPEMVGLKYPNVGHQPTEVYTNMQGSINVALKHTENQPRNENLSEVKKVIDAGINRPPIHFFKSQEEVINGVECVVIEFISPAVDSEVYNLMLITILEGRLAMVTFNCSGKQNEWKPLGREIIYSFRTN